MSASSGSEALGLCNQHTLWQKQEALKSTPAILGMCRKCRLWLSTAKQVCRHSHGAVELQMRQQGTSWGQGMQHHGEAHIADKARKRSVVAVCWTSALPAAHDAYLKVLKQGCGVLGVQIYAPRDVSSLLHEG